MHEFSIDLVSISWILYLISYSCHGFSIDLVFMSWIWANLGLGQKTISFIQGQTLISAKAPHGGYP